jgi:hypothetical protein
MADRFGRLLLVTLEAARLDVCGLVEGTVEVFACVVI